VLFGVVVGDSRWRNLKITFFLSLWLFEVGQPRKRFAVS